MQEILEYKVLIVAGAFLLFFLLERLRPAVFVSGNRIQRVLKNLSFWPLNIGLSLIFILPVSYFAAQSSLWVRPLWLSGKIGVALDIVLLDLYIFWWHRCVHKYSFLWRFHEIHHLDEHLDTTSAIRFHFGEVFLSSLVRALVIILCAIPISSIFIFETFVLVLSLFHHSNIKIPAKFENLLSKVLVTPSVHWVHHHNIRRDTDSNFGTIFSFWDCIFCTRSDTIRFETMGIGVEDEEDTTFLKLLEKPIVWGK